MNQLHRGVLLPIVSSFLISCSFQVAMAQPETPVFEAKRSELQSVDQLVNRNTEPKRPRTGSKLLVIPKGFNWDEYDRVFVLIEQLPTNDDTFWKLVDHVDDDRYSTSVFGSLSENYSNKTVGDVCIAVIRETLAAGYFNCIEPSKLAARDMKNVLFISENDKAKDALKYKNWLAERKKLPVYELQVIACKLAYEKLQSEDVVPGTPQKERQKWLDAIMASKLKIEQSRTPVKTSVFGTSEGTSLFVKIRRDELKTEE